ncbi:MAG: S8 family serine peptidase, partial [Bacteroidia bacterium]|nr:S8 family serine peptidase [Bacteroidia bacterium]
MRNIDATGIVRQFPNHLPPTEPGHVDLSRIYAMTLAKGVDPMEAARYLSRFPAIEYAEPWSLHRPFYLPNDPFVDTTLSNGLWYLWQIHAPEAWDIARGDSSIVVAVIDAGQTRHVDLYQNIAFNHADPIDGLDNDGDGYADNYEGWDLSGSTYGATEDNDPFVGNSHGLWVAGVSSAIPNNGKGLAGVGLNCRYLPIKAAPDDSLGLIFAGYPAIVYAADQGAQIINCSWGSEFQSKFGQDVVRYATINKRAALIVAAGNSQSELTYYPAGYLEAISVANTSFGDTIFQGEQGYSGSTYDKTVDVSAPGWLIVGCVDNNRYFGGFAGTSFSAPIVSGATGIVMSHFPALTGFQAAQRLRVTADPIDAVNSPQYEDRMGLGRINLMRALSDPLKPSVRMQHFSYRNQHGEPQAQAGDTIT